MLIILEGCDGAGKTTVAKELMRLNPGMEYRHFGPPERHPLAEYVSAIDDYLPGVQDLVIDRLHWGELVYGELFRGKSLLGPAGLQAINRFISDVGGVMVFVDANQDTIQDRLRERGDDTIKPKHVAAIRASYTKVWQQSMPHVPLVGFSTNDASHLTAQAKFLSEMATSHEQKVLTGED